MAGRTENEAQQQHNLSLADIMSGPLPPDSDQLEHFVDANPYDLLRKKFRRNIKERIFVNRNLRLDSVQYYGFDMDYTLAVYISPDYEDLVISLTLERLITKLGFPAFLRDIKFDPTFPLRGLVLDKKLGHILKLDSFGYILACSHGKRRLSKPETYQDYPDKQIHPEDIGKRFHSFDTLFDMPEISLYADLVERLENQESDILGNGTDGEQPGSRPPLSYLNLFTDLRQTVDGIHRDGTLKAHILGDIVKYVRKDARLPLLLHRLREQGKKTFLLTNSEFFYTDAIMGYMLNDMMPKQYSSWRDYFDIKIVAARKPSFFEEGNTLREVNLQNGTLKLTSEGDRFERGRVYSGGNLTIFRQLTGTHGTEVLYIGDNIYHDIVKSKKSRCNWRTLLVVRELEHELDTWKRARPIYEHLLNLEYIRAETYRQLDSGSNVPPMVEDLRVHLDQTIARLDAEFNPYFGSLFKSGSHQTFFASQVKRFSDIYTTDFLNLLSYPFFYYFSAPPALLPHEEESLL